MDGLGAAIEVDNLPQLRRHLRDTGIGYEELKGVGLEAAQIVADDAEPRAPFLEGHIQSTIRAAGQAKGGVVRAGSARYPYAGIEHFGWPARDIPPDPFLYDALDARRSDVVLTYQKGVDAVSKRAS